MKLHNGRHYLTADDLPLGVVASDELDRIHKDLGGTRGYGDPVGGQWLRLSNASAERWARTMEVSTPAAAGSEPLHFILRGIVALSENIIDDQDPRRVFDPVTVGEAGRAIRQTANGAITQAIQLYRSNDTLTMALGESLIQFDRIVSALSQGHTVSIGSVQNCAAKARAAISKAEGNA